MSVAFRKGSLPIRVKSDTQRQINMITFIPLGLTSIVYTSAKLRSQDFLRYL